VSVGVGQRAETVQGGDQEQSATKEGLLVLPGGRQVAGLSLINLVLRASERGSEGARVTVGHSGVMRSRSALVCLPAIGLLVASCSSDTGTRAPATTPVSARPAAPAAEPAVVPVGNALEGIVIGTSGIGAVAVRNPDGVELIDAATGAVRQTVPTDGAARHLSLAGPDGPVLVPLEGSNELCELNLADGRVTSSKTGVGRQPHDAAQTAGGTIVVTNELGGGVSFVRAGTVVASLPAGPTQPGGVAAVGDYAAVADVQGNGVWVYDGSTHQQVAQGPVGVKLTHAVAVSGDLAAFADTDGGAGLRRARRSTARPGR
jgi:hypothetical protein